MGCALSLPGCQTDFGGLAVNGALDVIEGTDPVQRLAGDGGFGLFPDIPLSQDSCRLCFSDKLNLTRRAEERTIYGILDGAESIRGREDAATP